MICEIFKNVLNDNLKMYYIINMKIFKQYIIVYTYVCIFITVWLMLKTVCLKHACFKLLIEKSQTLEIVFNHNNNKHNKYYYCI